MATMRKGKRITGPSFGRLRHDRRSTVAVMFAAMAVPVVALAGLAMDYGLWSEAYGTLNVAVNAAALNAVKTAGAADLAKDQNFLAEGKTAGKQWFPVELGLGANARQLIGNAQQPQVSVTLAGTIITATVTYSGQMPSLFGHIFSIAQYPLTVSATAQINTAPFSEIQILLDNSSSMQIAGSQRDMADMLLISPCSPAGASSGPDTNTYNGFYDSYNGYTYTPPSGTGWWPMYLPVTQGNPVALTPGNNINSSQLGPSCKYVKGATQTNGKWPTAGVPCAFACHSDNSKPAGEGNDLYALARSTIGLPACSLANSTLGSCSIQLRFDIVKAAVNSVIATMNTDNIAANNLTVGVSDFNTQLTRDYPTTGEAGNAFATAIAKVGGPPGVANGPDTGIQPDPFVSAGAHSNTDFYDAATNLANQLTPSGNGNYATTPRKFLFLVSDGVSNTGQLIITPIDTSRCDLFKNMGYTIYVVYTPYYANPHYSYFFYAAPITQSAGTSPVAAALQACASAPADYLVASDTFTLTAALQKFLQAALTSAATFTN